RKFFIMVCEWCRKVIKPNDFSPVSRFRTNGNGWFIGRQGVSYRCCYLSDGLVAMRLIPRKVRIA
ncbi:hypothetical protein, partial [Pseudoalteromonas sp. SYSU M81241]